MVLTAIAAVAENNVIGKDGGLPWDYPEDLEHFKETTMGSPLVMGRTTYESFGSEGEVHNPLPGRPHLVLTTTGYEDTPDNVYTFESVDDVLTFVSEYEEEYDKDVYVIGGASIYEQFLPHVDRLILSEIPGEYDGGIEFPEWDPTEWMVVSGTQRGEVPIWTYARSPSRN